MTIAKILEIVTGALATIAGFVAAAEDILEGGQRGKEKKDWVVQNVTPILSEHVHKFFGTNAGKAVVGALIDAIVLVANRSGNLSASPTAAKA